jgi:hypothetical protein
MLMLQNENLLLIILGELGILVFIDNLQAPHTHTFKSRDSVRRELCN